MNALLQIHLKHIDLLVYVIITFNISNIKWLNTLIEDTFFQCSAQCCLNHYESDLINRDVGTPIDNLINKWKPHES